MKSIEKLNFYNYVAKGKKIGEYFFFSGFKIYIIQTNKLIRKRNCVETIEGWQFNLVATAKSKFYAELYGIESASNTFQNKNTCILAAMREAKHLYREALAKSKGQDKAFMYEDDEDNTVYVVYAVNASRAKQEVASLYNLKYIDVRVKRCAWADQYKNFEQIPDKAWLDNGYSIACCKCGKQYYEGDIKEFNNQYLCDACVKKDCNIDTF